MDIWSKKKKKYKAMWHYLQERNPCTSEKAKMKQIIENESNLLNKIVSKKNFHIGLGKPAGPLARYRVGMGQRNSSPV